MENQKLPKSFNHKKYARRHVALMIAYVGWPYDGFVVQDTVENTIERHLFEALTKTMLIESRETSNYHRCGRTDKGVSAFRQVISIDLRSNLTEGPGVFLPEGHEIASTGNDVILKDATGSDVILDERAADDVTSEHSSIDDVIRDQSSADDVICNGSTVDDVIINESTAHDLIIDVKQELNYTNILNRVLPLEIKVLAWAPVPTNFSSRFDCKFRIYRYYFPRSNLNIKAMQEACRYLIGQHDFRNFCKVDMYNNKVMHCVRDLYEASITEPPSSSSSCMEMCYLTIKASSFIWHQIRCIMAVLLLVGEGKEQPTIVKDLLNIERQSSKPHYPLALDCPLVLYDCQFDSLQWTYDEYALKRVVSDFQRVWMENAIKANIMKEMVTDLETILQTQVHAHHDALLPGNKSKRHIPLLKRHTGDSVEVKMKKSYMKKAKKNNSDNLNSTVGVN